MKKTIRFILIFFLLLFPAGCSPEEYRLDIPAEGAVKVEILPSEAPPLNGIATTDPEMIAEIIDRLNRYTFHEYEIKGTLCGVSQDVRISYEDGSTFTFTDASNFIYLSDGTLLKVDTGIVNLSDYFKEKLDYQLYPERTRLRIPEKGIQKITYEPAYLPAGYRGETADPEKIESMIRALNMEDYYICDTYRTEFEDPYGDLVISYEDGAVIRYGDVKSFIREADGTWLERCDGNPLNKILYEYLGIDDTIIAERAGK